MKIWAISDLHWNGNKKNRMEKYGKIWRSHESSIKHHWESRIRNEDVVLVTGDFTWLDTLNDAGTDLVKLTHLPGQQKLIVRGNHDLWWDNLTQVRINLPSSITALEGTALKIENEVFCGTGGWISPNDPYFDPLDNKYFEIEKIRLKGALDSAIKLKPQNGIHLLLHFPPFTTNGKQTPFFDILKTYPVKTCSYGHFHSLKEWNLIPKGLIGKTFFQLASTDYLEHTPVCIWDSENPNKSMTEKVYIQKKPVEINRLTH